MVMIKICGVRDSADAEACATNAADLIGLNFVPGRRRAITADYGAELAALVRDRRPSTLVAGVFLDAPVEAIEGVAGRVNLDCIQLHGAETPAVCAQLAEERRVIKAFAVDERFDVQQFEAFAPYVWAFLFDGAAAGSGRTFDWAAIEAVTTDRLVFVAGGLTPDNVAAAIERLQPDGVDTASGVEVDGEIDPDRVRAFCDAARSKA